MEKERLQQHQTRERNWKNWGPYLSERAWGTVREDRGGSSAWTSVPFEKAHQTVFRWGEDGLSGICDRFQHICFAFALWNGKDPILKERLFGLTPVQGNHGEDVKELYEYLDATPTSSYLKMVYYYPQNPFPYETLIRENQRRGKKDPEYELSDTQIFNDQRYFTFLVEYAKEEEENIACRVTLTNNSGESAPLTLLPTLWFRNTWRWGYPEGPTGDEQGKPELHQEGENLLLKHPVAGTYTFIAEGAPPFLFCENDEGPYPKESFGRYVIEKNQEAINPEKRGTKAAAYYSLTFAPHETKTLTFRLTKTGLSNTIEGVPSLFKERIEEADRFYQELQKKELPPELKEIQRKAFAGLLFSKQFYYLDQPQWEQGDPNVPSARSELRNQGWEHLTTFDILSMPDKWEYPYFCAWDTAFHCLPLVLVDPDYAKRQLTLLTREWYMHPNGQIPAYEWSFCDVNPPVHAWALWRTYQIDGKISGAKDRPFLEGTFHKLLLNFTWWVNRKDEEGNNLFQGGFLGMDNISVFDRSRDLPTGGRIDQSDGSAWVCFFSLSMMKIALHLAEEEPVYQDMGTKFFEHFLRIAAAMQSCGGRGVSLWDETDGFFYDVLHLPSGEVTPLKVRSLVGLLPLLAVETLEEELMEKMPAFSRRVDWFIQKRPHIAWNLKCMKEGGCSGRRLLSIVSKEQLSKVLSYLLDENEFLSPFGIRSLSKYHEAHPYTLQANGETYEVRYVPGESDNYMFGGNSNWRGPIWLPINYLLIEALQKYHHYYNDDLKVEFPTRSGNFLNLWDVASEISKRLIKLFLPHPTKLPCTPLFYEYFHGDTGQGLGASHQTGWTGLIAKLIQQSGGL